MEMPPKVCTIAGSDSGGAAGLQADLKTMTALGVYGMSVITAVTAQNSVAVTGIEWMSSDFVVSQLNAVLSDYGADAVKTGFLGKVELITAVSATLKTHHLPHIIIDPVLVNHRQQPMFGDDVRLAYLQELFPLATLVTPNLTEAALLMQTSTIDSTEKAEWTAKRFIEAGTNAVLIKGLREQDEFVDLLFDGNQFTYFRQKRIETKNTHGSGDTLSASIAAFLAQGDDLKTAVSRAKQFTTQAIQKAAHWQLGKGHGPLAHF